MFSHNWRLFLLQIATWSNINSFCFGVFPFFRFFCNSFVQTNWTLKSSIITGSAFWFIFFLHLTFETLRECFFLPIYHLSAFSPMITKKIVIEKLPLVTFTVLETDEKKRILLFHRKTLMFTAKRMLVNSLFNLRGTKMNKKKNSRKLQNFDICHFYCLNLKLKVNRMEPNKPKRDRKKNFIEFY